MTSVLRLEDVSLHRGTTRILTHVNWSVEEGEHWVLLGPNGAGKTTVSRIAAARLFPSSGTADILGERMGRVDVSELHPRIGLCSSALAGRVPEGELVMSVVLSASYGRIGVWREEYDDFDVERARALLDALGAGELAERAWGTLSSGERKRVEIARALMPDPELLIRTGGELRISNYMLWQIAYSELYFCDTYWPDFNEVDLHQAIASYQARQRRFGKTGVQVESEA